MSDKTYPINEVDHFIISKFVKELSSTKRSMENSLQVIALLFPLEGYLEQLDEAFKYIQKAIDMLEGIKKGVESENIPH